jgi:hypothetical protein
LDYSGARVRIPPPPPMIAKQSNYDLRVLSFESIFS